MMLNKWEDKDWGKTRCCVESLHFSRHELELIRGGFCSIHYHGHRRNIFRVRSGVVRVVSSYGWKMTGRYLMPNESMIVRAHAVHQFQVVESGFMEEEYIPDGHGAVVDQGDIHRLSVGGMLPDGINTDEVGLILPNGQYWNPNPWITPSS